MITSPHECWSGLVFSCFQDFSVWTFVQPLYFLLPFIVFSSVFKSFWLNITGSWIAIVGGINYTYLHVNMYNVSSMNWPLAGIQVQSPLSIYYILWMHANMHTHSCTSIQARTYTCAYTYTCMYTHIQRWIQFPCRITTCCHRHGNLSNSVTITGNWIQHVFNIRNRV